MRKPIDKEIPAQVARETEEEDARPLQALADSHQAALLAFIAPLTAVRVSPVERLRAMITIADEFAIEEALGRVKRKRPDIEKAFVLLNSPGGTVPNAYQIARVLRTNFQEITTFVPHVALSGGTLLALTGNRIKMGMFGRLSPLDPQTAYRKGLISATSFVRFFERASDWFRTALPEEQPYPFKALTDQLDPLLMEEWSGLIAEAIAYAMEILVLAGYHDDDAHRVAAALVTEFRSHGEVIHADRARDLGLNVVPDDQLEDELRVLRPWLRKYLLEESPTHLVRYVVPSKRTEGEEPDEETATADNTEPQEAAKDADPPGRHT